MGNAKLAFKRYCIIDRCLNQSTKKYWLKTELLDALEGYDIKISPGMLEKDLSAMRNETGLSFQNAPIEYSKSPKGYHYTKAFSITMPFDEEDLRLLAKAAQTLNQFKDISYFNQFAGAVDKVVRLIKQTKKSQVNDRQHYILFEKVPYLRGYQHLDLIIEAIENNKCLSLVYQKFEDDPSAEFSISPYFVKEFHNRWYVVGFNAGKNEIRTYGLDRIVSVSLSYDTYEVNESFDIEGYFKDCIGINLADGIVQKVILSFSHAQGNYIKTQNLHRSQEILKDDDQELVVQLNVIINEELIMTLMSHGDHLKVMQPLSLADEIKERCAKIVAKYVI